MEISSIVSFILHNITTVTIVITVIYLRDRLQEEYHEKKFDIIHDSRRASYEYAEEIIEGIITTIVMRMRENVKSVSVGCPNGNDNCDFSKTELAQEFLIYHLTVSNVFGVDIHDKVINSIRKNGFAKKSRLELNEHIANKGNRLYEIAKDSVSMRCWDHIPHLRSFIGTTFDSKEAVYFYRNIVERSMDNTLGCEANIKKLRKEYSIFNLKKLLKGVLDG
jgi:hypothetical protein